MKTLIPFLALFFCLPAFAEDSSKQAARPRAERPGQAARPDQGPQRFQAQRAQNQQRPQGQQRAQNQQRPQGQQRAQGQQRGAPMMMSMRIISAPPEALERAGVSKEGRAALEEMRSSLRSDIGPAFKAVREADEAFREAIKAPDATEADVMPKLEAVAAAQLELRKKDVSLLLNIRDAIGPETMAKLNRSRNEGFTAGMRERMQAGSSGRPQFEAPANPKAPWLNDQGDRIKRPKRPPVEE